MILGHCLRVGKIYPYGRKNQQMTGIPSSWEDYERPTVEIMMVCAAFRQESEPILYRHNTIVLPCRELMDDFFFYSLNTPIRQSWVKSVAVSLTSYDVLDYEKEEWLTGCSNSWSEWQMTAPTHPVAPTMRAQMYGYILHQHYKDMLRTDVWFTTWNFVLDLLDLKKLHIDFSETRCHDNCCMIPYSALYPMIRGFTFRIPQITISTSGDLQEKADIQGEIDTMVRYWTSQRDPATQQNESSQAFTMTPFMKFMYDQEEANTGNWA